MCVWGDGTKLTSQIPDVRPDSTEALFVESFRISHWDGNTTLRLERFNTSYSTISIYRTYVCLKAANEFKVPYREK